VTAPTPAKRQLRFGYFLVPLAAEPLVATAQRAERLGLDYVGIQDHPYQRRFVDTWSLMAMIAASTTTLRIFPDVANLPLRPPAVMAKAAATIDLLSGGRFELGLGAEASGTPSPRMAVLAAVPANRSARSARPSPSSARSGAASVTCASRAPTTGSPAPRPGRSRPTRSASGSASTAPGRSSSPLGPPTAGSLPFAAISAKSPR
jgi:Luciferase-like monooxygenase